MKFLLTSNENFKDYFAALVNRSNGDMSAVMPAVSQILEDVRAKGDEALFEQIEKFDRWKPDANSLKIGTDEMQKAYDGIDSCLRNALNLAFERIKSYHEKSLPKTWMEHAARPRRTIYPGRQGRLS